MGMMKINRKRRSDRRHLIYLITNQATGDQYIGLTGLGLSGSVYKTLRRRMQKHLQRARTENKDWGLCESLRMYGPGNFVYQLLETVKGKKPAHTRELELIRLHNPSLNTFN